MAQEGDIGPSWVVSDVDLEPTRVTTSDLQQWILAGRIGLNATARREGVQDWTPVCRLPEFEPFFPAPPSITSSVKGAVLVGPDLARLTEMARRLRLPTSDQKAGFVFLVHSGDTGTTLHREVYLHELTDGLLVTPVPLAEIAGPGEPLVLYLVAINVSNSVQQRRLVMGGMRVPRDQQGQLAFSLSPGKWAVHRLVLPTAKTDPGDYTIEFGTEPGRNVKFSTEVGIMKGDIAQALDTIRQGLTGGWRTAFAQYRVSGVRTGDGRLVDWGTLLSQFAQYVTWERLALFLDRHFPSVKDFPKLVEFAGRRAGDEIKEWKKGSGKGASLFEEFLEWEHGATLDNLVQASGEPSISEAAVSRVAHEKAPIPVLPPPVALPKAVHAFRYYALGLLALAPIVGLGAGFILRSIALYVLAASLAATGSAGSGYVIAAVVVGILGVVIGWSSGFGLNRMVDARMRTGRVVDLQEGMGNILAFLSLIPIGTFAVFATDFGTLASESQGITFGLATFLAGFWWGCYRTIEGEGLFGDFFE